MVSRKTNKGKAVALNHKNKHLVYSFLLTLVVAFITCSVLVLLNSSYSENTSSEEQEKNQDEIVKPEENILEEEIKIVDFQPVIDAWVNSTGGKKGIVVYDVDRNEIVGTYNAEQKFRTASLYKLFVVYEGYNRLRSGLLSADEPAGRTGRSILECLDLSIRESNSLCAETIWAIIGHAELDEIMQNNFGFSNMTVSSLTATPMEILKIMQLFYESMQTEDSLANRMKDSFLKQPQTTYNWRQGLPSGFSEQVAVYNKVGWNYDGEKWTIYDDAAILDFINENRHFIAVVMTSEVNYRQIRNFGMQLEESFYDQYVLKN